MLGAGVVNWCGHYGKQCGAPPEMKNRTAIGPSNSASERLSKGNKVTMAKRYLCSRVHCGLSHNSQGKEATRVSVGERKGKGNVRYI